MCDNDSEKAEEMHRLRRTVKDLLNPEADTVGRPEKDGGNVRNTNNSSTDNESYALRRLKRDALRLLRKVVTGDDGRPAKTDESVDNVNSSRSSGNSKDYTLDRLKRDHPGVSLRTGTASIPYKSGFYGAERRFSKRGTITLPYRSL